MNFYRLELNSWLTERCLLCDSVNHIFIDQAHADAWECWNCFSRWWLDDLAKTAYTIVHGVDEIEAERRLKSGDFLIFLNGQSQQ